MAGLDATATRVAVAGSAVVGVQFGMGRFVYGLTLPDLRDDPSLTADGVSDLMLGLIASATFAGFLAGILLAPVVARRRGRRAPTTIGCVCGAAGGAVVLVAPDPATLAVGAVLVNSAAGWVWAPYSDLVAAVAPPARRAGLLALISTGTSAGLVLVALVAVLTEPSWRPVWAAVGIASAAAGLLNLRWTPRLDARGDGDPIGPRRRPTPWRPLVVPAVYTVAYYLATTLFFTYAAETLRRAGLPPQSGPALWAVIGVVGLAGLLTGRCCAWIGARRTAATCLVLMALALVGIALGGASWTATLLSAVVFAPGYMGGAAVIAVWTASLVPDRPTEAMTRVLTIGALVAVVGPTVVGGASGVFGLAAALSVLAVLVASVGVALSTRPA